MLYQDWAIIPHPDLPQLLLLPSEHGWALPVVEHAARHFWQSVAPVNQGLRALLAIEVTTLRCVQTDYQNNVYAIELHSPGWVPPSGAIWADRAAVGALARPEQRTLLEDWFAEAAAPSTATNRPPWYQPGWFARAAEWARAQLDRLGRPAIGPAEQLRAWERSAILRVPTSSGMVYFKAVPAMFAHEPALAQALAAHDPAHFTSLLAVDHAQHWMLMPDVGRQTLDQLPDLARWAAALRAFAQVQVALAAAADELVRAGCPRRALDQLPAHIDALLADTNALAPDGAALSAAEIAELRGRAGEFKTMCAQLARVPIPPTLEHGDFWAGQVVVHGDAYVFIDWSDSSIAHPFFSMNFFADPTEAAVFLPGIPDLRTQLRDAYLEPWAAYAPRTDLLAAFELAQPLAALHSAVIYHRWVLPRMDAKWEMRNMIPFYLRKLLNAPADRA